MFKTSVPTAQKTHVGASALETNRLMLIAVRSANYAQNMQTSLMLNQVEYVVTTVF
jgi:hypothetical protein